MCDKNRCCPSTENLASGSFNSQFILLTGDTLTVFQTSSTSIFEPVNLFVSSNIASLGIVVVTATFPTGPMIIAMIDPGESTLISIAPTSTVTLSLPVGITAEGSFNIQSIRRIYS